MDELKENLKTLLRKAINNAKDGDEKGQWITIKGTHVFIPEGKTAEDVIKEKGWEEKGEGKEKPETKKESNTTKDTKKHIDRIEKLIKKYNLEPHEEDELLDELGSFEAKFDENLEPREEEELREQLFDFEDDIKRHQEMKKQDKPKDTPSEGKKEETKTAKRPNVNDYKFQNRRNPDAFLQGHMKQCETIKDTFDYVLEETDRKFKNVKKTYWGNTPPEKQFRTELSNINGHNAVRDVIDSWTNRNKDYKPLIDDIKAYQQDLLNQLKGYNKWNGREWVKDKADNSIKNGLSEIIKNCKPETKEDLKILKGLKDILEEQ